MIAAIGGKFLGVCGYFGEIVLLMVDVCKSLFTTKPRIRLFLNQILEIGGRSQLVVIVTGAFTGAVFAAQTFYQFSALGMESAVGPVVAVSMCRELGPVLTGLMVAGRVGAAMSAELGTMKVSEQIDALRSMGVHPTDYLVVPRFLAMMVSMPLLVAESIGFGIIAGYIVGVVMMGIQEAYYISNTLYFTGIVDLAMGMIKGAVFGALIVFISCREGLNASNGAVGVGQATTKAVVISSLSLLIANFFLTLFLNAFL